jgi:hypothetical protein
VHVTELCWLLIYIIINGIELSVQPLYPRGTAAWPIKWTVSWNPSPGMVVLKKSFLTPFPGIEQWLITRRVRGLLVTKSEFLEPLCSGSVLFCEEKWNKTLQHFSLKKIFMGKYEKIIIGGLHRNKPSAD